jgi:hypothetical protein
MLATSPSQAMTLDDTRFPLVEVVVRDGHRDADWRWLLGRFDRLFAQKLRYVLLVDARTMEKPMQPLARAEITEWMKQNHTNTELWSCGASVVMASGLIRGALTALTWFAPQKVPMNYPATYSEALDWCVTRLEESSLPVPMSIRKQQVSLLSNPPPSLELEKRERQA